MRTANDNHRAPLAPIPTAIQQPRHPGTGVLCRGGRPIYYGFAAGIYIESPNPEAVDSVLYAQEMN